jgi:benzoyl-CoA reductase/2-hydroxyglutaryl-CoA dehydratase subunit BcrC/BadD/HgdB
MNLFEIELERMQKRVAKLKDSLEKDPNSKKLQSNLLLYEMDIATRKSQIKALQEGKPFFAPPGITPLLAFAMGFHPIAGIIPIPNITPEDTKKYFDDARGKGGGGDACDMSIMVFSQRDFVEAPDQTIDILHQTPCTVQYLAGLGRTYTGFAHSTEKCNYYYMDIGFEENEANLVHVTEQLREFIELAEKTVPGVKYDEAKLIELQAHDEAARKYNRETYEMLRNIPSPVGGKDAFWLTVPFVPGMYPDPVKAVEAARVRRDEVAERAEKGIPAVPGEKARLLWTTTRPFFMDVFQVLEKWKIVVPFFYSGPANYGAPIPRPKLREDRELTPLEKEAATYFTQLWCGRGDKWVDAMMWFAKDLKVDGIVNYCQRGATCVLGLKKLIEDRAEKELGIPVLQLEGAQFDDSYQDEAQITAKLDEFAQIVLDRKKAL